MKAKPIARPFAGHPRKPRQQQGTGSAPINWIWFPKSDEAPELARGIVHAFEDSGPVLAQDDAHLGSNDVLALVRPALEQLGFRVETGKRADDKIYVPVLFGRNGKVEKAFEADAWHREGKMVLEVEGGRGYLNNQFLKDLFQACMMHDVEYGAIAVRNRYLTSRDFESVAAFFETLYASNRLNLPLKGVLIVGYGSEVG